MRHGFTVLELSVVIAILGVLAVLLFPSLQRMRVRATIAPCMANQRQIVSAMMAFASDNQGKLPDVLGYDGTSYSGQWWNTIRPYLDVPANKTVGKDFLRCPAATKTVQFPNASYCSYGLNYASGDRRVFSYSSSSPTHPNWKGSQPLAKLSPSMILIADAYDPNNPESTLFYSPRDPNYPLNTDRDGDGVNDSSSNLASPRKFNCIDPRHGNAFVAALADGSTRLLTIKEWAQTPAFWGPNE